MVTGFFKKLKNKLFNSSSKFTKNLDEAVKEATETDVEIDDREKSSEETLEKNKKNEEVKRGEEENQVSQVENMDKKIDVDSNNPKVNKAKSVVKKAFDFLRSKPDARKILFNDDFVEKLEDVLISSDVGSRTA